ncbi:Uncharacterized membrane protein [Granulicella rosea]|uniref:Uncharacterized membrane protein n=1 Tax=Granulicella rosea TaxID=474952 RepID=A0A239DIB7_9BACT|nr:TMEM175 family protein [Granulicella rosea]SNS31638.1 Uncharacterized membrane protein [Granulicella rosea]
MSKTRPSPGRLEAFSDGVLAVVITIMVLELKVPHESGFAGLQPILPILLVYLLSFAVAGIYWINHHELVHRLKAVDEFILYANLGFLFCISLMPFFTDYVLEKHFEPFSVMLYGISMVANGLSFWVLRVAVNRVLCLEGQLIEEDIATQRKHIFSLFVYLIGVPLAYRYPRFAMADIALVTVLWIIPTFGVKPNDALAQPHTHDHNPDRR